MLKALLKGVRRVVTSPRLVIWLWLVNVAVALPATWVMADAIEASIGSRLVDRAMTEGFDISWYDEFTTTAKGLEATFTPTVVGAGAFLGNLERWLTGELFSSSTAVVGLGVFFAVVWTLFMGGILHQLTTGDRFSLSRFLSSGARFFFRFLRLAALSGVLYYLIYRLSRRLYSWVGALTIDVTVERTMLTFAVIVAVVVIVMLGLVNMVFDYAKIVAFKEDRRSMILAVLAGVRFVVAHPLKTTGVYAALGVVGGLLLVVYASIAPGALQSTVTGMAVAFGVGQMFLVSKLGLRLTFYASQIELHDTLARHTDVRLDKDG